MVNVAVLASGEGSNLQAILDACKDLLVRARVVVVVSDRADANALDRARRAGVDAVFVDAKGLSREDHDAAVLRELEARDAGVVLLAGYMRILSPVLVRAFAGRLINIHPALLPAFPGLHGARQALQWGAKVAGATTHFVDDEVDHGPIILQAAVPVAEDDDEESLVARIHSVEHGLYPLTLKLFAEGRLRIDGRRVHIDPPVTEKEARAFGLDPATLGGGART